jgi:hypothetical protein
MTLVMMAMLFMFKERLLNEQAIPLLSCSDIEILLTQFFTVKKHDRRRNYYTNLISNEKAGVCWGGLTRGYISLDVLYSF